MKDNSDKQNAKEVFGVIETLGRFREITDALPGDTPLNFRAQPAQELGYRNGILFFQETGEGVRSCPAYFIATENGITDIDAPPSDN